MWFDGIRQPNTLYVLDSSRGKDSTAALRAIKILGWPLDAVACADMWATKDIPAARPEMLAFQDAWDAKCKEIFNIPILKPYAKKKNGEKLTYEDLFYRPMKPKHEREREGRMGNASESVLHGRTQNRSSTDFQCRKGTGVHQTSNSVPYGFPISSKNGGNWCTALKTAPLNKRQDEAQKINIVHYIGIAADEPKRIKKHIRKKNIVLPLVQIGWDEALCGLEATYMGMLSPTYCGGCRDGCWFCHNQTVDQLRRLRKEHPDLWEILLKWDSDSPVTFRPPGKNGNRGLTVHDFDKRFQWEDDGFLPEGKQFRWADLEQPQMNFWQMEGL